MDVRAYNRKAWNELVENRNCWTVPVTTEEIQRARNGDWQIVLTPTKPVPRSWFPDLDGASTLCLASGGGQQGPILAAAGATVTVLDASPRQLEQDRTVAEREGLSLETVEGDMADLSSDPHVIRVRNVGGVAVVCFNDVARFVRENRFGEVEQELWAIVDQGDVDLEAQRDRSAQFCGN